jgi:uncharacterized repeat protein (TIGR01451 family)
MNLALLALTLPMAAGAGPMTPAPASFTFVKVLGPFGSTTTWYPATPAAISRVDGLSIGLRPGYSYRFELGNVGLRRNAVIWPSIEVRGALVSRPSLNVAEHPIPIFLSEDDVERILEGRFLTKVYYLENPDQAVNGPQLGVPLEISAASEVEAIKQAQARGRIMIIVRAGERLWTPDELAYENIPGTIWAPSVMKSLPTPAAAPCFPVSRIPLFDPLLGPKELTGECLYDGGDRYLNLGIGRENKLFGLDPSDTAMEFTTPKGKHVVTSNRVCICVPRFAVERVEVAPLLQHNFSGPQIGVRVEEQKTVVLRASPGAVARVEQPVNAVGGVRASGLVRETAAVINDALIGKPAAVALVNGTKVTAQLSAAEDLTVYPDCSLILAKRMDPPNPKQIGEIVTFYLSYRNPGTVTMSNVVVNDSLTGRLEYIEGSEQSDRGHTFTAAPNEAGSLVLRWAIDGQLLPGQRGVVSFRARIR